MTCKYSIIIGLRNTHQYLDVCIGSVLLHTDKEATPYELIVVDGSTRDGLAISTKTIYHNLFSYIDNTKELGVERNYGIQQNKGAKIAKGDFIIFLNEDTAVHPDWLLKLESDYNFLSSKNKIGLLGASSDNIQSGQKRGPNQNVIIHTNFVITTCAMIKRETFEQVGGYDEQMLCWNYHDNELSYRLHKSGFSNFVSTSYISHFGSRATKKNNIDATKDVEIGSNYFIQKHKVNPLTFC